MARHRLYPFRLRRFVWTSDWGKYSWDTKCSGGAGLARRSDSLLPGACPGHAQVLRGRPRDATGRRGRADHPGDAGGRHRADPPAPGPVARGRARGGPCPIIVAMGLHPDLDESAKMATCEMIQFLMAERGLTRKDACIPVSLAADLAAIQLVDGTRDVHAKPP